MKIKSLTSLFFSTFLVSSFVNAMDDDVRLSDAINGISPKLTNSSNNNNSSAASKEERLPKKFNSKCRDTGTAFDQVERFFGPMTRQKGAKELRKVANVVCDFFYEKAEKANSMKALFEGFQGRGLLLAPITTSTFNLQAKFGQHIAMVRAIQNLSNEISDLENQQKTYPTQKAEIEQKIKAETKALKAAQAELTQIEEQEANSKKNVETAEKNLNTASQDLENLTTGIGKLKTQLGNVTDEQTSDVTAQIDNLAVSLDQQQKRTVLTNDIREHSDNLVNARLTYLGTLEGNSVNKEKIEEKIEQITKNILRLKQEDAEQEEHVNELSTRIQALQKQKPAQEQELQEKADTYAFMKYLQLVNIYLALPNDEKSYYEKDVKLTTLSPDSLSLIRQVLDVEALHNSNTIKSNMLEKLPKALTGKVNQINHYYNDDIMAILKGKLPYTNREELITLTENITSAAQKPITREFEVRCKNAIDTIPDPIPIDEPTFNNRRAAMLNDLRADKLVKASMEKWKKKISREEGSLVQRLGLDSFLFNAEFNLTTSPDIFSFAKLQQEFPNTPGEDHKDHSLFKNLWALGVNQIENSLYAYSGDTKLMGRTDPIYNFAFAKSQSQSKETKRKKGDENHEATYAALKYFSYTNMAFAVRYDIKGEKSQSIATVSPVFKDLLKELIPDAFRIDNVLAGKAIKWGKKLQEYKEFINTHALTAYTLAPLNVLGTQDKN